MPYRGDEEQELPKFEDLEAVEIAALISKKLEDKGSMSLALLVFRVFAVMQVHTDDVGLKNAFIDFYTKQTFE